jgi:DNA (cytosine-5)-methyltransferase 1
MIIAGLFAGIGGFELGMHRAGHRTELLCDVLPSAQAVLQARFPNAEYRSDITQLRSLPASIDLVCAGFPCQDLSQAGRTAGIDGERSGLIGEVFRLLSRRRVPTVVIENVPFMLQLNGGNAIRSLIDEFERRRYRWAYRVVDSFSFGLAQRRERVVLVASHELDPSAILFADDAPISRPSSALGLRPHGFYWTEGLGGLGWAVDAVPTIKNGSTIGIASPPAVLLPDGRIVKISVRDGERLQGFDADWTLPAENVGRRSSRWGLVGSAVSVPVAQWLGERLSEPGTHDRGRDAPFPLTGKAPRAARFDGVSKYSVRISTDPLGIRPPPLVDFMHDGNEHEPLSIKATAGFLSRTRRAKLRFEHGFIHAVENHLIAMGGSVPGRALPAQMELLAA